MFLRLDVSIKVILQLNLSRKLYMFKCIQVCSGIKIMPNIQKAVFVHFLKAHSHMAFSDGCVSAKPFRAPEKAATVLL